MAPALVSASTVITQCSVPGIVALCFDDGPYIYTSTLLGQLSQYNVKATFFVNGDNYEDVSTDATMQQVIKSAYSAGHQIASHGYQHLDLTTLNATGFKYEVQSNSNLLRTIIGRVPAFYRPPFGNYNDATLTQLKSYGFKWLVMWSIDTFDYMDPDPTTLVSAWLTALKAMNTTSGGVIGEEHDTIEATATQFVPLLVSQVEKMGWRFGTVAECIGQAGREYQ